MHSIPEATIADMHTLLSKACFQVVVVDSVPVTMQTALKMPLCRMHLSHFRRRPGSSSLQ